MMSIEQLARLEEAYRIIADVQVDLIREDHTVTRPMWVPLYEIRVRLGVQIEVWRARLRA